jgi:acetylornithine deacetylase/succinyl-diaminopimelate desuccinylase-like protein
VQCSEKVPHTVVMTARGPGGHAAVPQSGNAILRLARAITRIGEYHEPLMLSDITRQFLASLSTVWPEQGMRAAMADATSEDAERVDRGMAELRRIPALDAVLRNGISPTLISGGIKSNVIPTEAECTLNIRTLPGESIDDDLVRLAAVVSDPHVTFEVRSSGRPGPASSPSSSAFAAIRDAVSRMDPAIVTVPYLSTGATDSAAVRSAGTECYGLLPFPLTQEDESRMHGHDERVGVEAVGFGLWLTCAIVEELNAGA